METTKPYVIYARKSTESDEKQIQSIDDQIKFCKNKAKIYWVEILALFTDEKSAKAPRQRTWFTEMFKLIEEGKVGGIISWKLDRITRNPVDTWSIQYALQMWLIDKIITNDRDYLPWDSWLIFSVETGMANQFILDLSKNTKRGMRWKAERGGLWGPAPHWYRNNRFDRSVEIDTDRFEMIKNMWKLLIQEKLSLSRIADIVNEEWGFRTIQKKKIGGKKLSVSSLYNIFTNPFYTGSIRFKGEIMKWAHTPMITMEEFEEAQRILWRNTQAERPKTLEFAYTWCMKCGECGCAITAEMKKKVTVIEKKTLYFTYYHCTHTKDGPNFKCWQRAFINEKYIESQIIDILSTIEIHPDFVIWAKWVLYRLHGDEISRQEQSLRNLDNEIEKMHKKLWKLLPLLIEEVITNEEYKKNKQAIEKELIILEEKRKNSNTSSVNWIEKMENTLDFISTARRDFIEGDIQNKKRIFRAIGSNLILKNGEITVEMNSWFKPFTKVVAEQKSPLNRLEPVEKSINLREIDALDVEYSRWLPEWDSNLRPTG